ncbi:uncharacterized protein I303_103200 [Kwoniella dejecticola CBS 10117]|uniref:Ser/Thr-rich protein T10 in DGCR region n=1 Tax=Kwoniella dejecticola CBS 10117 TaxID=1296121 RepID=A0A1A6AAX1_9TREE|nr:uncharacterized protein I303_03223 [Kwoniella dejecticola CBS 10117]OBR87199.1 hypothetical protein I303_03223 [Kwoniella dejecticola CBS 10117]
MCIAFFTLSQPGYKLILASNRDEFLARPTEPAQWHDFASSPDLSQGSDVSKPETWVLSGIDKGSANGGTWLGITKDLRVGILTNVRLTPPTPPLKASPNPPSRGLLLKQFLSPPPGHAPDLQAYLESLYPSSGDYEGFNLLLFSLKGPKADIGYLTNRPSPSLKDLNDLSGSSNLSKNAGCMGISNSPIDEPWPKVQDGSRQMEDTLKAWQENVEDDKALIERLFGVLSHSKEIKTAEDTKWSTTIPLIDLSPTLAQRVSTPSTSGGKQKPNDEVKIKEENPSVSVDTVTTVKQSDDKPKWYGTRTSTIILVKDNGETTFVERDILRLDGKGDPISGDVSSQRWYEFKAEVE